MIIDGVRVEVEVEKNGCECVYVYTCVDLWECVYVCVYNLFMLFVYVKISVKFIKWYN